MWLVPSRASEPETSRDSDTDGVQKNRACCPGESPANGCRVDGGSGWTASCQPEWAGPRLDGDPSHGEPNTALEGPPSPARAGFSISPTEPRFAKLRRCLNERKNEQIPLFFPLLA